MGDMTDRATLEGLVDKPRTLSEAEHARHEAAYAEIARREFEERWMAWLDGVSAPPAAEEVGDGE